MPNIISRVSLSQKKDAPLKVMHGDFFKLKFAYYRSVDAVQLKQPNQDYLTFTFDKNKLAFVICDGVSQSFFSDIASKMLGDYLIDTLWELEFNELSTASLKIQKKLQTLPKAVEEKITKIKFPDTMPYMLKEVLEKQRKIGSESTFAGGIIDKSQGKFLCTWMGDTRIKIWNNSSEISSGFDHNSKERWSSKKGAIGNIHFFIEETDKIENILAFSDGLLSMDRKGNSVIDKSQGELLSLAGNIERSHLQDDVSFLHITLSN